MFHIPDLSPNILSGDVFPIKGVYKLPKSTEKPLRFLSFWISDNNSLPSTQV